MHKIDTFSDILFFNNLNEERWLIESAFKDLNTSDYNNSDTHLADIERVNILLPIALIAFARE